MKTIQWIHQYSSIKPNGGPENMSVCLFTCGCPYSSYEDRGNGHDQAAKSSYEGKDLGVGSWRGRKNPLKIDLPGNPPQHLETETP